MLPGIRVSEPCLNEYFSLNTIIGHRDLYIRVIQRLHGTALMASRSLILTESPQF